MSWSRAPPGLYKPAASAHAAGAPAHLHFIQKSYPNEALRRREQSQPASCGTRGTPRCALPNADERSQRGVHRAGYLLLGIWLKCALFLHLRVPYCALACHYLQMGDFTVVGHVNAACDVNSWTHQRESFPLWCPSFH